MDHVLLHGTTQSPACWDRVGKVLTERGHRAFAIDFPVDQPDLLADDYARIAMAQLPDDIHEPVVTAHSGGGLILTALANRLAARHLVWIGALIPDFAGGASLLAEIKANQDTMFGPEWPEYTGDDPTEAAYFLFQSCDLATLRWAMTTLRPFRPVAAYGEQPGPPPTAPSTYVLPRQDRTLAPPWMRTAAPTRLNAHVIEVEGDHCPHIAQSQLIADILTDVH
jgi:pimeloyl-ACP methyl ester carboxylesterase